MVNTCLLSYYADSPACAFIGKCYEKILVSGLCAMGLIGLGQALCKISRMEKKQEDRKKEREGQTHDKMPTD